VYFYILDSIYASLSADYETASSLYYGEHRAKVQTLAQAEKITNKRQ
jgi:hypothetical protein